MICPVQKDIGVWRHLCWWCMSECLLSAVTHLLKWDTSAVRAAQLQPCLISHLITPPNVTHHRHHSLLMSFTHNSTVFNTAQIFRVMLHLLFACTYYFIFVFCFFWCPGNLRDDICNMRFPMSKFSHAYSWALLMHET